jgi:hypothetical protein
MAIKTRPALKMTGSTQAAQQAPADTAAPVSRPAVRLGKVQFGWYLEAEAKRQIDAAMNGRTLQ